MQFLVNRVVVKLEFEELGKKFLRGFASAGSAEDPPDFFQKRKRKFENAFGGVKDIFVKKVGSLNNETPFFFQGPRKFRHEDVELPIVEMLKDVDHEDDVVGV